MATYHDPFAKLKKRDEETFRLLFCENGKNPFYCCQPDTKPHPPVPPHNKEDIEDADMDDKDDTKKDDKPFVCPKTTYWGGDTIPDFVKDQIEDEQTYIEESDRMTYHEIEFQEWLDDLLD